MDPQPPTSLPMAGAPPERADAAANRERILLAARALVTRDGAAALRMDAVAAEAGVGKGTVFRRFGDRGGLRRALVDDAMRAFQDGFLRGPPPLGPGAPAGERLEAFVVAWIRWQTGNLQLALLAEPEGDDVSPPHVTLLLHVGALLRELHPAPEPEPDVLAGMLLAAITPSATDAIRLRNGVGSDQLERAALVLARGITRSRGPAAD